MGNLSYLFVPSDPTPEWRESSGSARPVTPKFGSPPWSSWTSRLRLTFNTGKQPASLPISRHHTLNRYCLGIRELSSQTSSPSKYTNIHHTHINGKLSNQESYRSLSCLILGSAWTSTHCTWDSDLCLSTSISSTFTCRAGQFRLGSSLSLKNTFSSAVP